MRCTTTLVIYTILVGCALSAFAQSWTFTNTSPTQIQVFVVPANSPRLRITAVGASGGVHYSRTGDAYRGRGAMVSGIFYVAPGTNLYMIVGTTGGTSGWLGYGNDNGGGGGGGGSFLWNPSQSLAYPMIAAGGGGGGSIESYAFSQIYAKGIDASFNPAGANNWQSNGGAVGGATAQAPGGKGWNDIKGNPNSVPCSNSGCGAGGYGGGGGSNAWGALAGGGGGYSGGAGGVSNFPAGAGGGSYVGGAQATSAYPTSYGDGYILIEVAPACDGDSDFDFLNQNCLCRSGFSGLGCQTGFGDCTENVPKMNVTYPYPVIDTINQQYKPQFSGDSLVLNLRGPFVRSRRYIMVSFQGANPASSCNFAGANSYWTKWFDSNDTCQDILRLTLPWSQKTACGFAPASNGGQDLDVYYAKMQLQFSENMGTSYGGVVLTRTTSHTYDIYVYFPNKLTIVLNNTNVIATVQLDVALSNEQYDPITQSLGLDFTTVTPWSGRLSPVMVASGPAGINVYSAPAEVQGTGCLLTSGSACQQQYHMAFAMAQNASLCNFDGVYTLNTTMFACRLATGCSSAPVTITFLLQSGSVCASIAVRPTITGAMNAYSSPAAFGGDPVMNFKLGDRVYFLVTTNAGTNGNHVNITFNSITYTNTQDGTVELYNSNNNLNSGRSAAGVKANVFVSNANKYWYMYFSGEQFQIPFGTKMAFSFQATVTVLFVGGVSQKRTIEMIWEAEDSEYYPDGIKTDVGTMVELYKNEAAMNGQEMVEDSTVNTLPTTANQLASGLTLANVAGIAIGGVVVGVVLVMGVVFSIYKKMQAQLIAAQQQQVSQPLLA